MSLVGKIEFHEGCGLKYKSYIYEKTQNDYKAISFCKAPGRFVIYLLSRPVTERCWESVESLEKRGVVIQVKTSEGVVLFDKLNFEEQNDVFTSLSNPTTAEIGSSPTKGVIRSNSLREVEVIKDSQGNIQEAIIS